MAEVIPFVPFLPFPEPDAAPAAHPQPPDAEARTRALDIHRSFIVEAPAGSGKTGLLIQRYLKLLADDSVTSPEQVLAITFTIKATAELRDRVLEHLESAAANTPVDSDFDRQIRTLAEAVLERDRQLHWSLLTHPHRLNIRTIDSVCAEIARTLPVLSGSGGRLAPAIDPQPLYREAARRTLLLLGSGDSVFDDSLRDLLLHRDGNLADCETLLADMLGLRDQWGALIPLAQPQLTDAWLDANVLPRLQAALEQAICSGLDRLVQIFPPNLLEDLAEVASHLGHASPYDPAAGSPVACCAGVHSSPQAIAADRDRWVSLASLLTTKQGEWRKERGLTGKNLGFIYDRRHPHHSRLSAVLSELDDRDDLLAELNKVSLLPPAQYPADQWAVAKSLFRVLSRALVELQLVFATRGQCDFTELSLLARAALTADSGPEDLAAALGARLQHLLVDEMQDTSAAQYDLIELLTASWDGHSQTVFLVGDPRQSIYLFRQARVERFLRTMRTQRLGELPLTRLRLTANFRSQQTLVHQFNEDFANIFPNEPAEPLPYANAEAVLPASSNASGLNWHATAVEIRPPNADRTPAELRQQQARRHAREIRRIARQWLSKPLPAGRTKPWQIAVLVRNRSHLAEIVAAFDHETNGGIPYRAVEITPLNERIEVLDLTALTRALLHPADRVATLAVLHAPWCGLSLADLHTLTGADDPAFKDHSIPRLMADRGHLLSEDSIQRLQRVWRVLSEATTQRARLTTAQLVERAWRSLGGDTWLTQPELINARRYFQLLDEMEAELGVGRIDPTLLDARLQRLYAEPNAYPPHQPFVDLLTIHAAKGLEWDVVFVPALDRRAAFGRARLLVWSELPTSDEGTAAPIMLAPIAAKGEEIDPLTRWLKTIHREREAAERKRVFYVAATRAREELHLFAAPDLLANGNINPWPDSLLKSAWPAAQPHFAAAQATAAPASSRPARIALPASPEPQIFDLAAAAEATHSILQRLPLAFDPTARFTAARTLPYGDQAPHTPNDSLFARPEGSFAARSFGNVVHTFLELLAVRVAAGHTPAALLTELPAWTPRIAAILRADGLPPTTIDRLTRETRTALENALRDADGLWVLASHAAGASELALTTPGTSSDTLASIRIDRIFHACPEPHTPGNDHLWIVDYKTASHGTSGLDDFLTTQRATYAPQLETYAGILAPTHSKSQTEVRLALYYPAIPRLIWWKPEAD